MLLNPASQPPRPRRPRRPREHSHLGQMRTREFLGLLPPLLRERLPEQLQDFQVRGPMFSLLGFYYGEDPRIHYEVWAQHRTGRLEIGLHFEADPGTNTRGLEYLSARAPEIVAALGPGVEGEQWTESWTRLHETSPLEPFTPPYAERVAERLAAYIDVLEPLRRGLTT